VKTQRANSFLIGFASLLFFYATALAGNVAHRSMIELGLINDRAIENAAKGNLEEAKKGFLEVLNVSPNFYSAKHLLKLILDKEQNVISEDLLALVVKGAYAVNLKKYDEAINIFQEIIRDHPSINFAYGELGNTYLKNNNIDEAMVFLKKAIELGPSGDSLLPALAAAYLLKNQYKDAAAYLEKAVKIDPYDEVAHYELGSAYFALGYQSLAESEYEKALNIQPEYGLAYFGLANLYYAMENYQKAIENCDKALALGCNISPQFLDKLKPHRG